MNDKPKTRQEKKENQQRGKMFDGGTLHKVVVSLTGMIFIGSILLLLIKMGSLTDVQEEALNDYNGVLTDVTYNIRTELSDDRIVGVVESEKMTEEQAIKLGKHIQKKETKEVDLYIFTDKYKGEVPKFYTEGLRLMIQTYPENYVKTKTYNVLPTMEPDLEILTEWKVKEKESYVDEKNNQLNVALSLPTLTTVDEMISFVLAYDEVVHDINNQLYEATIYSIERGLEEFEVNTNHPNILANVLTYQTVNIAEGDD